MPLKSPRIKYEIVIPSENNRRIKREGDVAGFVKNREELVKLLLHPWPDDSRIENLRQVDNTGKDVTPQPPELSEEPVEPTPIP